MSDRTLDSLGSPRPTREALARAVDATVDDVIAADLSVLFCGINPGLYTAAVGHHFARPGNRFWRALYGSHFTDRLLVPSEERELLGFGCGITNLVARTTASAKELRTDELKEGAAALRAKLERFRPRFLAVLGIGAFQTAFGVKTAPGPQGALLDDHTEVWVLPNPSGLQAHYQLPALIDSFSALRDAIKIDGVERPARSDGGELSARHEALPDGRDRLAN